MLPYECMDMGMSVFKYVEMCSRGLEVIRVAGQHSSAPSP